MPLVFTQNEISVAEIDYADVLGEVYEYPARYRTLVQPGEAFVYYRGRRRSDGSSQTPSYLGCGIVGNITEFGDRFRCSIEDYRPFKRPVPFKSGDFYREPEANNRTAIGFYYQVGVRPIDQRSFEEICEVGLGHPVKKIAAPRRGRTRSAEAPRTTRPRNDSAVHNLAMALASAQVKKEWPGATLFRAPFGLPFSFAVRLPSGKTHHIAVKATAESRPLVRLTEDDISFSTTHAADYSMWVFYDVDVERGTANLLSHDGGIPAKEFDLDAALHSGEWHGRKAGKKVGPIRD